MNTGWLRHCAGLFFPSLSLIVAAWIVGNGIGGARSVLPQHTPDPSLKIYIFSHNYLLEICYENGIIGVISVFGGIAWLLIYAIKAAKQKDNKNIRILINCMVVAFISWLIHTGLTFPFYSKYSLYSSNQPWMMLQLYKTKIWILQNECIVDCQ